VVDHAIEIDFGSLGLGGVARGSLSLADYWAAEILGDGYYELDVDTTGHGSFASPTKEFFYRLVGDVTGFSGTMTGASGVVPIVDQNDLNQISAAQAQPGVYFGDVDGSGTVDSVDLNLATRSKSAGRKLGTGLRLDG
jgi:hypothetical protein